MENEFRDVADSIHASYEHHPMEDMEPLQREGLDDALGPDDLANACLMFRRIFSYCLMPDNASGRSLRFHIFSMLFFQDLREQTCDSIAEGHGGGTRQMVNKELQSLLSTLQLSGVTLKNSPMRNVSTRQKCKNSQITYHQLKTSSESTSSLKRTLKTPISSQQKQFA